MFAGAERTRAAGENDLVPYWVFPGRHAIERIVPTLPLAREVGRMAALRRSVAAYRLTIGQPRQDDLLRYLADRFTEAELAQLVEELRIDLSPRGQQ